MFLYVWLPFMILPIQAALERVPVTLLEASGDLGARPVQTFRHVLLPLAFPGVIAGSIFTFSLTLGDYIIPQIIGTSARFIGQAVYQHQGTAGNIPLGRRLRRGAHRHHGALPVVGQADGGVRCFVSPWAFGNNHAHRAKQKAGSHDR